MSSGSKSPAIKLLLILAIFGGIIAYSSTIGKDTLLGRHTNHLVGRVNSSLGNPLEKLTKAAKNIGKPSFDDPEHYALRDACMASMFLEKSGFHFSQSRWGGAPVPYQFRGLEIIGPEKLPHNASDSQKGIDLRIGYKFHVAAYRRYDNEKEKWEAWRFEPPPNLTEMSFARQDGTWKIAIAPHKSYAVR